MKVIVEVDNEETFVEVVLTDADCYAIDHYDFLTKQTKIHGKIICFAIRKTINGEEHEDKR